MRHVLRLREQCGQYAKFALPEAKGTNVVVHHLRQIVCQEQHEARQEHLADRHIVEPSAQTLQTGLDHLYLLLNHNHQVANYLVVDILSREYISCKQLLISTTTTGILAAT